MKSQPNNSASCHRWLEGDVEPLRLPSGVITSVDSTAPSELVVATLVFHDNGASKRSGTVSVIYSHDSLAEVNLTNEVLGLTDSELESFPR